MVADTDTVTALDSRVTQMEQRALGTTVVGEKSLVDKPAEFTGDRAQFRAWQSQLRLYLSMNQSRLPTDRQRVLYACSTIRGDAYAYVQHIVDSSHQFMPVS